MREGIFMPKHENKNGKNLLKILKTLDYSPVARYVKNVGCIFDNYAIGAQIQFAAIKENAHDNICDLNGYLSLYTYNNDNVSIPLRGPLYYAHTAAATGVEANAVDLTNVKAFVFSGNVMDDQGFDLLTYGLYNLFNNDNGNNNNNNNAEPFYPVVTLAVGPLLLKDAKYVSGNENIACFVAPNYRVYLIPADGIVYLSADPATQIKEYQNALKANQENDKQDNAKQEKN